MIEHKASFTGPDLMKKTGSVSVAFVEFYFRPRIPGSLRHRNSSQRE